MIPSKLLQGLFLGVLASSMPLFAGTEYNTLGITQVRQNQETSEQFNRLPVSWKNTEEEKKKAETAWKTISEWQKEGEADYRKLHVVYVTLKNRPPLKDYKARLDRIVKNIQAYYSDQMKENGYPPLTFPIELDEEGKLIVHDAHLDMELNQLDTRSSGDPTRKAAVEVLKKAGIDTDRNYVLVVAQMPDKQGPYYGMGTFEFGCCWICDAEHLDTRNFLSTEEGDYLFKTLGQDNTVYIGGTAHELGHCFSLPHTMNPEPPEVNGTSLMGSGNYTYGQELRNEGKGTYLIQSDALRLASIPLFSGKERKIKDPVTVKYEDFSVESLLDGLKVSGTITGTPPVYGMVAYYDPAGGSDYDATPVTAIPDQNGKFTMDILRPGYKGIFELRLVALHANGAQSTKRATLAAREGGVDVSPLLLQEIMGEVLSHWQKNEWKAAATALDKVLEKEGDNPLVRRSLPFWKAAVNPQWGGPKGNIPGEVSDDIKALNLVNAQCRNVSSGWWAAFWNSLPPNPEGPEPLFYNYTPETFLYTHADGEFTYDLGGKWKEFTATAGMPLNRAGAIFVIVRADGKEIFKSNLLKEGRTAEIKLDVSNIKTLTIEAVKEPGRADHGNWCVIADPVLRR